MALDTELMSLGMPAGQARAIGSNVTLTFSAAGNNSQTNAAAIVNDFTLITTSGSTTNSVILPSAVGASEVIIAVASAQTTLNIFPALGQSIVDEGTANTVNTAVTLAASHLATFFPAGNVWFMNRGA